MLNNWFNKCSWSQIFLLDIWKVIFTNHWANCVMFGYQTEQNYFDTVCFMKSNYRITVANKRKHRKNRSLSISFLFHKLLFHLQRSCVSLSWFKNMWTVCEDFCIFCPCEFGISIVLKNIVKIFFYSLLC